MKDLNYAQYAKYLDQSSKEEKLVKNAPESAKKAFAEHKAMEDYTNGDSMKSVVDILMMSDKERSELQKKSKVK